jgi:uncharacterized protein (TIGR03067 family)
MGARVLLVVVAAAMLGFAPAPLPRKDRQREDSNDVEGVWEFVRCETNGVVDPPETCTGYRIEISRKDIAFIPRGGQRTPLEMTLDPSASPPSFTWGLRGTVSYVGSYRLHRGELTMMFTLDSRLDVRPKDFGGKPPYRYVMRRVSR